MKYVDYALWLIGGVAVLMALGYGVLRAVGAIIRGFGL